MNNDILLNISSIEKNLTKAEHKVADFVLQSPHEILYMSITDLAEHCGVGDTTVFRFCKTLKISGYQDFKMMLAQSLSNRENIGSMTLSDEINLNDSVDDVCRKLLNTDIAALKQTMDMINTKDILTAVDMIANAKLIYFYGAGASSVMAMEAFYKFARILPNVISNQDIHMQAMSSSLLNEDDLAIAFSYSGTTKDVIDILKRAKHNHAKTICVTRFAESPLTAYSDIVLLCGANEGPFQGGALSAKVAQLYLLDILYTEYFKKNYVISDQNKKRTTQSIASKLL
jgi:DNA-binding MurR/RpiR family transcriptional regulator